MSGDHEGRKPFVICEVNAGTNSVELRQLPGDWECDRSIKEHIEIIGINGVLVEVIDIDYEMATERLLETDIELVTFAGPQREIACATQNAIPQPAGARSTRQD